MTTPRFLDEIGAKLDGVGAKISELTQGTPAHDLEKNCKAMLSTILPKLDLVKREEYEVQRELLAKAVERIAALEERVTALEK